jgi:integrase
VAQLVREGRPGKIADGACRGLTLKISAAGQAAWVLRYTDADGRRRDMGLGAVAAPGAVAGVSLGEARDLAVAHLRTVRAGTDPLAERAARRAEAAREVALTAAPTVTTFRQAAEAYVAANETGWRNAKHGAQWTATLKQHAFPLIGALPVGEVTTEHVLSVLTPLWVKIPETAARVRQRIEAVLDAAKARGQRQGENPARWKGHLAQLLPKTTKVRAVQHRPALPMSEMPAFYAALSQKGGTGAQALRFVILTAARSGEVRGAVWGEIDFDTAVWRIPGTKMKAGRPHRVALSVEALNLLRSRRLAAQAEHGAEGVAADALVFPSRGLAGLRRPISDQTISELLKGMSYDGRPEGAAPRWCDAEGRAVVPHGFRATFKGWSRASGWADHLSEAALAHADKDKTRAAYAREDGLDERRPMMEAWAAACLPRAGAEVVSLRAG